MRSKHLVQAVFTCLALVGPGEAVQLQAAGLTQPLTAEEVACNERQLERLLGRLAAGDEVLLGRTLAKILLVSYSNSAGFYDGLALTTQQWRLEIGEVPPFPAPPEHYLGFHINPSVRRLLLNPERIPLGQVALEREETGSNLLQPGASFGFLDIAVRLDPTLPGNPQPDLLVINNFAPPQSGEPYNGFLAASTKPGRGLDADGLLTPCHGKFSAFDRHVFALLQRMIRAKGSPLDRELMADFEIAVFRGEAANSYRANVYVLGGASIPHQKRLAVELELTWTPEGRLTTGVLRALPLCAAGQELGCSKIPQLTPIVFLIRPVFGGQEHWDNSLDDDAVGIHDGNPEPPIILDIEALLAGTKWNPPPP